MKKLMLYIIYVILCILCVTFVSAMNCTYDSQPFLTLTQSIDWNCVSNIDEGHCYGIVLYEDELLHIYPDISQVQGQGVIDYFVLENNLVNVKFDVSDLYEGYNYSLRVICSDVDSIDEFEATIFPVRRDLSEVAFRGVWVKENMSMIFLVVLLIVIVLILIKVLKR